MSKQMGAPRLTMRGGALVLRGVTLFLAAARSHRAFTSHTNKQNKGKGRKNMSDKDACKCSPKLLEIIKRDTSFSRSEIEALYKIYKKLITFNKTTKGNSKQNSNTNSVIGKPTTISEGIDRVVFREVLHNTFDIVTENMLMERMFCVWDKQNYGLITLENWFNGLSLNCLIKHPQEEDPDESVKDLVDIVMRKIDKDKDGKVSLQDYRTTVEEEPLLLEAFGRCLPSENSKITFLTTLKS
ncbi:hypothetical protein NQ314_002884 [Rhamnusium bicolor]|uniref:EF-hand domain-containing protein n=1 Tax=Rhamnusium bicolor TaxID=1586634 RepID=A0AAV8ZRU7_9CUCU|nr:hypothetical protein NQ314_002884 [Rhamnusium bicolor]